MKNILLTVFLVLIWSMSISCNKNKVENFSLTVQRNNITDTLKLIKDTTVFVNSTEGEEVKLFINKINRDSIIESEVFGETGKSLYKFIFNKKLKEGECHTYKYKEPIYVNSNPKIKSHIKESLYTSIKIKEKLSNIFKSYREIIIVKNNRFDKNWDGVYTFSLNEDSDDWRDIHDISLTIKNDSIIYEARGYQLYQLFYLSGTQDKYCFKLKFQGALDNTDSWVLKETKDFGTITFDGRYYSWECPYVDKSFNEGKKQLYILKKEK